MSRTAHTRRDYRGRLPGRRRRFRGPSGDAIFFFKQKTAYEIGLGIPAEPLFRSIPKLRLILILNSFLGSSDSLVFSELFHSLAPRPLAARSISDFLLTYLAT